MSENIMDDLIEFLKASNLSTYGINAFIALLKSSQTDNLTAREISNKSNVPSGRIYEVLEDLQSKKMIEIIDSRPKKYRSLTLNKALDNLITHQTNEEKRKASFLYQQAKIIESKLYDSTSVIKKEPSKIFWSTAFGVQSIFSLYLKHFSELQGELLMIDFINDNTEKILPYGRVLFEGIKKAVDRGILVKTLWSFGFDDRPLSEEQKDKNQKLFVRIKEKLYELYDLSPETHNFGMKFVHKKVPTYFDIFDKKRIIFKLQNPISPWQIFSCMNVLDPKLAEELREKYFNIWTFEAID